MGKSNSALALYLDEHNIPYIICNDETIKQVKSLPNTIVVKSPGIPMSSVMSLLDKNILVMTDLELFYLLNKGVLYLCITGTNGKTTTCNILNHLLSDIGFKMGGNMGIPLFSLTEVDKLIVEASSFMLDGTKKFHPHIYVLTNLTPHHIDVHGTFDNYVSAKFKPLANMSSSDIVIYHKDIKELNAYLKNKQIISYTFSCDDKTANCHLDEGFITFNHEKIYKPSLLTLSNNGLILDIMIGIMISKIYHISNDEINTKLSTFKALEHRFELVENGENLKIINDSKATNPSATLNAIACCNKLYSNYNIYLVLGGKDGKEEYDLLNNHLTNVKKIFLYGENRFIIEHFLKKQKIDIVLKDTLDEVVEHIFRLTFEKVIILFSPASSSKDQFESFEHRGKYFKTLINNKINLSTLQ